MGRIRKLASFTQQSGGNIWVVLLTHLSFLCLVGLRVYAFLQHELWRDEAQLPLMARDAQSFGQLLHWQSYGREHVLWPSILYCLKKLGLNPVDSGLWLHLGLSILLLGIIFYGIPRLPLIFRILLGSSYLLMYEYSTITRVYGASVLLLGIFIMLELRSQKHILWKALTLFFLALSSNVGLALALVLAFYLFVKPSQERLRTRAIGAILVVTGIGISIATALPPSDLFESPWQTAHRASAFEYWGIPRLLTTSVRFLLDGFLYIPRMTSSQWYESYPVAQPQSLLFRPLSGHNLAIYFIGVLVIALALLFLWRLFKMNKLIAITIAIFWGGNLFVWATMHPGLTRHFGILVLGTLGLLALLLIKDLKTSPRWLVIIVSVVLVLQSISGFWAVYAEGRDNFSQSKNLAQWLQTNYPNVTPYVYPDCVGASLSMYTGGYAYSLASRTGEKISFVQETKKFTGAPFTPDMITALTSKGDVQPIITNSSVHTTPDEIEIVVEPIQSSQPAVAANEDQLLITSFPFHAILDEGKTVVEPIQSFQPATAPDEAFWVHRVHRGSKYEPWTYKLLPFEGTSWTVSKSQKDTGFWAAVNVEEPNFDNEVGSTIEIKFKFIDAPESDTSAFVFQVFDGNRTVQVSFLKDGFIVNTGIPKILYKLDTTDDFHVYRFTLKGDVAEIYADGKRVGSSDIIATTTEKRVLLGNLALKNEAITAQIGYVAYFYGGALPPERAQAAEEPEGLLDINLVSWPEVGSFTVKSAADTGLTISTRGSDVGHFSIGVPEFNNTVGSTAEVKLKLLEGPINGLNGAKFAILDGEREGGISFFSDHINILDAMDAKACYWLDTTDTLHTYRIAMVEKTLRVYVDSTEVAVVTLSNQVTVKRIYFGDFSTEGGENMSAKVSHLAYSANKAMTPDGKPITPIKQNGEEGIGSWTNVKRGFAIKTAGTGVDAAGTGYTVEEFDNNIGSTAEVKVRILEAPASGHDGAMLSLVDDTREAKLCFFSNRIEILDGNNIKETHYMNTGDSFHVYRTTLIKDTANFYVDDANVATVTLQNNITGKKILFGDLSSELGETFNAQVEYLAFSVKGAMTPQGIAIPTAPVVDITPDSPKVDDNLECTIVTPSIAPNRGVVSYTYAWYRDGVLQPELTTNIVSSSNTEWGETWRCVVTPNNGNVNGLSTEDQITIDIGMWTKFSGMQVLPESEPESPWGVGGTFDIRSTSEGILTFKTSGTNTGSHYHTNPGLENTIGSTAEVKMKILAAPASGHDGAMFSLVDGTREAKICFFSNRIEILDRSDIKETYYMNTGDSFHVYRTTLINDTANFYVDDVKVATVTLQNNITGKKILFGDLSSELGENLNTQVEYLAYSVKGAIAP